MAQKPVNTEDLWKKTSRRMDDKSVDECRKLIESCCRRCAVVECKGLFTKYQVIRLFYN